MCWNASVSFTTLAIGSFLNIISYSILRKRDSIAAAFVYFWQYALLMQLPEGIAWIRINESILVESRVAFFLNITQPLVTFLILWHLKTPFRYGHVVLFMYFLVLFTHADELWENSTSIAPVDDCKHLNLGYWDTSRGVVYIVSVLLIFSELESKYWIFVNAFIFLSTLVLSLVLYSCSIGSLWCWMISIAGPILVIMDYIKGAYFEKKESSIQQHQPVQPKTTKGVVMQFEHSKSIRNGR